MRKILLIGLIGLLPTLTSAASVQSGSAFLRMDTAARPAAMAGAYAAQAGDLDVLAYNPGGLATLERPNLSFTHAEWLQGTRYEYLAYGQPTRIGKVAFSAIRLGYGDLEGRDTNRLQTGSFSADDSAYTLAYANSVASGIGLGGAFKYLRRTIDTEHASSYAMDFGALGQLPSLPVRLGASILNIGPGTRFIDQTDPLPLTFDLGAAYTPNRRLTLTSDFKHEPNDQRSTIASGMEYSPSSMVALRAGYQFPVASTGDSVWSMDNVRGGLGINVSRVHIDYALAPYGELGLTHRFTVSIELGPEPAAPKDNTILHPAQLPREETDALIALLDI